jgi:hypothetical protein
MEQQGRSIDGLPVSTFCSRLDGSIYLLIFNPLGRLAFLGVSPGDPFV